MTRAEKTSIALPPEMSAIVRSAVAAGEYGSVRPEDGEQARLATVGNYAILFRVVGKVVRLERVTYGGRNLPATLDPS